MSMLEDIFSFLGKTLGYQKIKPKTAIEIEREYVTDRKILDEQYQIGKITEPEYQHYSSINKAFRGYESAVEFTGKATICRYTGIFKAYKTGAVTLDQMAAHNIMDHAYGYHAWNEGIADYHEEREVYLLSSVLGDEKSFQDSVSQLRQYQKSTMPDATVEVGEHPGLKPACRGTNKPS